MAPDDRDIAFHWRRTHPRKADWQSQIFGGLAASQRLLSECNQHRWKIWDGISSRGAAVGVILGVDNWIWLR